MACTRFCPTWKDLLVLALGLGLGGGHVALAGEDEGDGAWTTPSQDAAQRMQDGVGYCYGNDCDDGPPERILCPEAEPDCDRRPSSWLDLSALPAYSLFHSSPAD